MSDKKWFKITISLIFFPFFILSVLVVIIDPYFHFHKPLKNINYDMNDQRYINDGIIRHFKYNAIITGTSMTENFKSSQFDKLFHINSIKVPFSGGAYKEINDNLERSLKYNQEIKYILRGLDYNRILDNYDASRYKTYPTYLYDNNLFNDTQYIFNKKVLQKLRRVIKNTLKHKKMKNFDEYSRWNENYIPGKESILKDYKRPEKENAEKFLIQEDYERIYKNIEINVTRLPKQYPNVKFIYFITPYSIVYWDELNQKGEIEKQIMAEKYMIEKILEVPNIELYSFYNNYEMICNLDNYKDAGHYMGHINDQILFWIKDKKYRLTKENYQEYIYKNLKFYKNYDYESIFN